jgi:hypothetical protein
MAYHRHGGAATKGFAPHNLTVEEKRALYHARYPVLLDMRLPSRWRLSMGGVGIPPVPIPNRTRWWEEIHIHCATLTEEERTSLQWDSRNDDTWQMFFQQRRELELAQHDGGVIPPPQKN